MILLLALFLIVLTALVAKYLKSTPKVKNLIIIFIVLILFAVIPGLDLLIERVTQSDINIFLITVFVIGLSWLAFRFRNKVPWLVRVLVILIFIGWFIDILIPNIPLLISPMTPAIKGKVFDAETQKPLANVNIKVAWPLHNVGPGGGGGFIINRTYSTKSDEHGEFTIPRRWKPLSRWVFPLGFSNYAGIEMISYSYDYEIKEIWPKGRVIELPMKPIKNEKSFFENILKIYWEGVSRMGLYIKDSYKNVTPDERNFFVSAYPYFEKRFPNANYAALKDKAYVGQIAVMFDNLREPMEAIRFNQLIIEKYPSSTAARLAARDIEQLKEKYHVETEPVGRGGIK